MNSGECVKQQSSVVAMPGKHQLSIPRSEEAELALCAAILGNNHVYYNVYEHVTADEFYNPSVGKIFTILGKTIEAGRKADAITLQRIFETDKELIEAGGNSLLANMAGSYVSQINSLDYAKTIRDLAARRRLIVYAQDMMAYAYAPDVPEAAASEVMQHAESVLYALSERSDEGGAVSMDTAFDETVAFLERSYQRGGISGISVGIPQLDRMLGGLQRGCLISLAGRPSMGKTAIGMTMAMNAAMAGFKVMFCSLEMTRTDLVRRMMARQCGIPTNRQVGNVPSDDVMAIMSTRDALTRLPIFVDDCSKLTFAKLRSRVLRQKRRRGVDLVVIDYLGLMSPSDPKMNRNYQIEEITKGLKDMAKEFDVAVLLLSQVNRGVESRDDKRPMLSDLRDSGSIEQDSDIVMFIYRHEYYLTRSEPNRAANETDEKFNDRLARWEQAVEKSRGKGELIVAKHRQGEIGTITLRYESWKCLFIQDDEEAA